jgi:hypothetical protein
MKYY